jgi:3-oxoacyl-[acyl-carrier-protein] synthase III
MAFIKYNNVGILGMAACVPKNISRNEDLTDLIPPEEIQKVINNIGIKEKRFVDNGVTPADLCFRAAEQLLNDMEIDRNTIDMVIFMSQLPDHKIPATAPSLQHRLGLPKTTACFDVNLACSGYIYSLSTAFAYASQEGINRVLLLDGETFSRIINPKDKVNMPLYGDAGTATLIEKGDFSRSFFTLYTDGSGQDAIKIEAGGARCPANAENVAVTEREEGNMRSGQEVYMDGLEVFNFTMRVVPSSVKEALALTEKTFDNFDHIVFHQANRFMIEFFVKKLKIPAEKVPYSLDRFGNTSSATIPLTIVSELSNALTQQNKHILMSGFGAGLSWATAIIEFKNAHICPLIEY